MNLTADWVPASSPEKWVFIASVIVLGTCAFVLNVLVVVTILVCPGLRYSLTHLFVLSLAINDGVASMVVLPLNIYSSSVMPETLPAVVCQVQGFLASFLAFNSVSLLSAISVERCYSISHPMEHAGNLTLRKTLSTIFILLLVSIVSAGFPLVGWNSYGPSTCQMRCTFVHLTADTDKLYVIFSVILFFFTPLLIVALMYCAIYRHARQAVLRVRPDLTLTAATPLTTVSGTVHSSAVLLLSADSDTHFLLAPPPFRDPASLSRKANQNRFHPKAIRNLAIILLAFVACWGPLRLSSLAHVLQYQVCDQLRQQLAFVWLSYASFLLNPILYGLLNVKVRAEMKNTLLRCWQRRQERGDEGQMAAGEDFFQFLERTRDRSAVS